MGERLSSVFSPDRTLISASAGPHCGNSERKADLQYYQKYRATPARPDICCQKSRAQYAGGPQTGTNNADLWLDFHRQGSTKTYFRNAEALGKSVQRAQRP